MLDECDVTHLWRKLFRGRAITSQLLAEAELLVGELPMESPLRLRFISEINELSEMNRTQRSKRRR